MEEREGGMGVDFTIFTISVMQSCFGMSTGIYIECIAEIRQKSEFSH